jgi:hypothetical protein
MNAVRNMQSEIRSAFAGGGRSPQDKETRSTIAFYAVCAASCLLSSSLYLAFGRALGLI